jgi:hypothetical protein
MNRTITMTLAALTLAACQPTPEIALDDPLRARADARLAGSVFGASGIAGIAYVGATNGDGFANLSYDENYTTTAEIAAAPAKVCAHLNGTVATVDDQVNPSPSLSGNFRVLFITCNV